MIKLSKEAIDFHNENDTQLTFAMSPVSEVDGRALSATKVQPGRVLREEKPGRVFPK